MICRSSIEARRAIRSAWLLGTLVVLAVLLCVACSGPFLTEAASPSGPAANQTAPTARGGQNKAAEAARIDLARRINVDAALLSIKSVEPVWWSDSCLGAPGPDEVCKPVRTPGFRVVLSAGEYRFVYRTDRTGEDVRLEDFTISSRHGPCVAGARALWPCGNDVSPFTAWRRTRYLTLCPRSTASLRLLPDAPATLGAIPLRADPGLPMPGAS